MRGLSFAIACVVVSVAVPRAQNTNVVIQPPTVTGPIALTTALRSPDHGYPYNATPIDLAKQGYVEEEFFLSGQANRYSTPAGERGTVLDTNHAYTTRIVVRRPKAAARFNGTAIVEWYNVSQGHDGEFEWFQAYDHFLRSGFAWVGVSAQAAGVNALKEWSPVRYATLDVTRGGTIQVDAMSYDIFSQAALAVRGKGTRDIMGGLRVQRVIATGHSQSAGRLYTYFHSVHPLTSKMYDAVLLHGGGGRVSPDLNVKVFKYLDESDVIGQANSRVVDSAGYRQWEIAGSSHLDAQFSRSMAALGLRVSGMRPVEGAPAIAGPSISGGEKGNGAVGNGAGPENEGTNGGCAQPPFSRVPSYHVLGAAFDAVHRWLVDGVLPPSAPPVELRQLPPDAGAPADAARGRGGPSTALGTSPSTALGTGRGAAGPRWDIVRDDLGLARGGIRVAALAAPIARNTGDNVGTAAVTATGERNCRLMGSSEPFDAARLASLYPTHDAYVAKVREATEKLLRGGFIDKVDADQTIRDAEKSAVGRGSASGATNKTATR
jgi:alpha/beta hydrolase family protein